MKPASGKWRRSTIAIAVLVTALVAGVLAPAGAAAVDSDLKHAFAFKLDGSNGYSITAFAVNERADGKGEIVLFVTRKGESATYLAPAQLTATSVTANLGALGKVSLEVTPSGRKKKLRPRAGCGKEQKAISYEPLRFSGSFEFKGEQGYTEVSSSAPTEYTRFFLDLTCGGIGQSEITGKLPGARLRVHLPGERFRFELQANKNRPDKRSHLEVEVREERGAISIARSTDVWLGSAAFQYDPLLETATLRPPAPFSGVANFYRRLTPENRWSGNLAVDLPGRADVPLTGPGVEATLVPACRHQGSRPFRC